MTESMCGDLAMLWSLSHVCYKLWVHKTKASGSTMHGNGVLSDRASFWFMKPKHVYGLGNCSWEHALGS